MTIKNIGSGSIMTADVRQELADQELPHAPHFVIRASHDGPLALTTLALDASLLLDKPIKETKGWIVAPIKKPLAVGQRLGWSVFAEFKVPQLAAFLVVNKKVRALSRKKNLEAGGIWASAVTLRSFHLI